jgi:seryl-tRNA synthetase
MSPIDDTIQAVSSAKSGYEQAAQELAAAVGEAEKTRDLFTAAGAEGMVEAMEQIKEALETIAQSSNGLTGSLDDVMTSLESAKG